MKAYVVTLIVIASCISAIAALLILSCLCNKGSRKKENAQNPTVIRPGATAHSTQKTHHHDVEKGERRGRSSATKDGGMVILAGTAGVATAAAVASISAGGCGCGGGGCGGGGCGGGGCGGC